MRACAASRRRSASRCPRDDDSTRLGYAPACVVEREVGMKLCIVTGASRGLGLALARALGGESGTRVLAISRSALPAETLVWRHVAADLATDAGQDAASEAVSKALDEGGWTRAVLMNNAATLHPLGVVGRVSAQDVRTAVSVNLTATIVLMNA